MKIADGLLIQKDITKEVGRLEGIASEKSHSWMSKPAGEEYLPTYDLEENHQRVLRLHKLHRRLSRAITKANNETNLTLTDADYEQFI